MDEEYPEELVRIQTLDVFDTSSSSESGNATDSSDIEDTAESLNWVFRRLQSRPRTIGKRNAFEHLNDWDFEKRFRLPRTMVDFLLEKIKNQLDFPDKRNSVVSARMQILITLRYYATGAFQTVLADTFGVSQATVSRCIEDVSKAIASLAREEIKFPGSIAEVAVANHEFYKIAKMPHAIGVIDGTHIPLQSPGGPQSEIFRNRKGYFSINTQIACSANMRILDIVARWPGSNHDQSIFNFSQLKIRCENGEFRHSVLLGDAGYSCKKYLITPLSNPETEAELRFQRAFVKTRIVVERTIGVWKRRFSVIATKMRCQIETAVTVIVATSVLHNWLRERPVPPVDNDVPPPLPEPDTVIATERSDFSRREHIIGNYF